MKTNSPPGTPKAGKPAKALRAALGQSKAAKGLVEDAAQELGAANDVLKVELAEQDVAPAVEIAIEQSSSAEDKVVEASEKLAEVNEALAKEIDERHILEFHLAAATEQKDAARHAALHDPLTGLPNRDLFYDRLEHGLAQSRRHAWNLAVMFIDLDNFKVINDSHGHQAGDRILETIATRLLKSSRADDTICRLGGDEFLYLMMEPRDEKDVQLVAEKIIEAIEAPFDATAVIGQAAGPASLQIRASIGISQFPKDSDRAEVLISKADKAMYQAKRDKSGYSFAA